MKYNNYKVEDFVEDDYFQSWVLDSNSMTDNFWRNWMASNPDKKEIIKKAFQLIKLLNATPEELSSNDFDDMWQNIVQKRTLSKNSSIFSKSKLFFISKIAAVFVLGITITVGVYQFATKDVIGNPAVVLDSGVTLELEDGTVKLLNDSSSEVITNSKGQSIVKQNQNILFYNHDNKTVTNDLVYNVLSVPYGKKFELVLSDGSHVFLNSGSKLRYPVTFLEGKPRDVFLDGEAYFSVEKDEDRLFTVRTDDMNIRVYGTKFNVSSYKNENNTSAVLVEGSVSVYKSNNEKEQKSIIIEPGQRAVFEDNYISVNQVDISKYVAWIEGKLLFIDHPFELILKELERHYDVIIDNKFLELNKKKYTGTFQKESLYDILKICQAHTPFDFYTEGNTLTIVEKSKIEF
ncbi:FecR family protein [Flavivirga rizhaonensis]|uniref:DUF4974 domain-containing protein n=1 Tax=Flavivirga rizhaonensis TaxID=2559571 RepID=A0A4V3P4S1_9FLAO|nr:FecR family protein [Flavivirga rizhaonensis]TGV02584.1 DUF4974 domain-containing protein [Flavivirga rizhaonensis]